MIRTITLPNGSTEIGSELNRLPDGRVTIASGRHNFTGWPAPQRRRSLRGLLSALVLAAVTLGAAPAAHAETLLNVSYDPTRELYREFNEVFAKHWESLGNPAPTI